VRARIRFKKLIPKRAATGDLLLEVPGADASRKADALTALMREHIGGMEGVRVTRPIRRIDLRVVGFDESIAPREIAEAISVHSDTCCADDVRMGPIPTSRSGMCTAWVQAPAIAGVPAAVAKSLSIGGWGSARVLLKGRSLRCFRCLAPSHVQRRCPCPKDRSRCCYNCGSEGHIAAVCRASPHCVACAEKGKKASHRIGASGCPQVRPFWMPRGGQVPPRGALEGEMQGAEGVTVGTARSSSADTVVLPRRAGGVWPRRTRPPLARRERRLGRLWRPPPRWRNRYRSASLAPAPVVEWSPHPTTRWMSFRTWTGAWLMWGACLTPPPRPWVSPDDVSPGGGSCPGCAPYRGFWGGLVPSMTCAHKRFVR